MRIPIIAAAAALTLVTAGALALGTGDPRRDAILAD